ncbi:MAG: hypothetical protein FWE68_03755 [Defluviitaleaceae bacterium]|nr:hypothetical protein [Defluviitaleaceae bacterium]
MARPGLFQRIGSWLTKQREGYNHQKTIAERDKLSEQYMAAHDAEFQKIDGKGLDAYDNIMEKYAHRVREQAADDPTKEGIGEKMGDITYFAMSTDDGSLTKQEHAETIEKGKGIGAFFGRLFNGRLFKSDRDKGQAQFNRFVSETGFAGTEREQVAKLAARETELRKGTLTAETVVSKEHKVPGMNPAQIDAANERFDRVYGEKKDETLQSFQAAVAERRQGLKDSMERQESEFFSHMGPDANTRDAGLTQAHCHNIPCMDTGMRRTPLARLYMHSMGDSLDQIYADTPESQALRAQRGKEFTDLMTAQGPDAQQKLGDAFARMGGAIAEFPSPDIASDAAIYTNMRDFTFIQESVTAYAFLERRNNPAVYDRMANHPDINFSRTEAAIDVMNGIIASKAEQRMEFMTTPQYAGAALEEDDYSFTASRTEGLMAAGIAYDAGRSALNGRYQPGMPMAYQALRQQNMTGTFTKEEQLSTGHSRAQLTALQAKTLDAKTIEALDTAIRAPQAPAQSRGRLGEATNVKAIAEPVKTAPAVKLEQQQPSMQRDMGQMGG